MKQTEVSRFSLECDSGDSCSPAVRERLTCGFDLARLSIFIQASSLSFSLAFSLEAEASVFSSRMNSSHVKPRLCLRLNSLVLLGSELLCAVVKQLLVHLHEELQCVIDQAVNGPAVIHEHRDERGRVMHSDRTKHLHSSIKHRSVCLC